MVILSTINLLFSKSSPENCNFLTVDNGGRSVLAGNTSELDKLLKVIDSVTNFKVFGMSANSKFVSIINKVINRYTYTRDS